MNKIIADKVIQNNLTSLSWTQDVSQDVFDGFLMASRWIVGVVDGVLV
ncbi:MAG: hypothetical protein Q6363_005300 [Candidatus Njordarchaeota archaeon]